MLLNVFVVFSQTNVWFCFPFNERSLWLYADSVLGSWASICLLEVHRVDVKFSQIIRLVVEPVRFCIDEEPLDTEISPCCCWLHLAEGLHFDQPKVVNLYEEKCGPIKYNSLTNVSCCKSTTVYTKSAYHLELSSLNNKKFFWVQSFQLLRWFFSHCTSFSCVTVLNKKEMQTNRIFAFISLRDSLYFLFCP